MLLCTVQYVPAVVIELEEPICISELLLLFTKCPVCPAVKLPENKAPASGLDIFIFSVRTSSLCSCELNITCTGSLNVYVYVFPETPVLVLVLLKLFVNINAGGTAFSIPPVVTEGPLVISTVTNVTPSPTADKLLV